MSTRKKKSLNFLQKLRCRELYGEVRECRNQPCQKLFQQLPHRLAFRLAQIAPASALQAGHVFLGFTKCGQFILSYTHSYDTDDHTLQMAHRYRLHWWLFTPYAQLRKVAEVMLFGDQDLQDTVCESVFVSVCQWPKDISKILVYGCSLDGGEGIAGSQTRRVYITITAVPSLDNCSACSQVAKSYEEDDLAERWNSCVRFSCLQHGITVHTSFEMVPPFPKFMAQIQMKLDGCVVLNAGNFIHVLSVNLENMTKKTKESNLSASGGEFCGNSFRLKEDNQLLPTITYEEDDNNSPTKRMTRSMASTSTDSNRTLTEESTDNNLPLTNQTWSFDEDIDSDKLRVSLRDKHDVSDKDREWEILIGTVPKPYADGDSLSCPNKRTLTFSQKPFLAVSNECNTRSIDSDCSSVSAEPQKSEVYTGYQRADNSPLLSLTDDAADSDESTVCSQVTDDSFQAPDTLRSNLRSNGCPVLHSPETPSKQAEKEYEFIDEISDANHEKLSAFRRRRLAEKKYEFSDENSENVPQNYRSFRSQSRRLLLSPSRSPRFRHFSVPFSELSVELGETSGLLRTVYEKLLSPSSGSSSPNDVLRPINQNISSPLLSPRDDKWREDIDKLEKAELQRWSSRESLTLYSPVSHYQRFTEQSFFHSNHNVIGAPQTLKCVVDIKRRFIEIDDELVSIITDIEDDELSSATGYHNALPLEVHGSGYSQMHMISNSKAEKLSVPGVFIRQVSLDVEQFCHETAQRLCNEAGKKYFFCHDYNVEIVEVCPTSGNVIALASVLVQAGVNKLKSSLGKSFRGPVGPHPMCGRRLYKATATFVFNVDNKTYFIIDKEPLVEYDPYSLEVDPNSNWEEPEWWMASRIEARELRSRWAIPTDYFSSVKVLTNEAVLQGKSLTRIMEPYHLIALIMGN